MMKAQSHDTTNVAIRRRRHLEVRFFWQGESFITLSTDLKLTLMQLQLASCNFGKAWFLPGNIQARQKPCGVGVLPKVELCLTHEDTTLYQNVVFFYELSSFYYICNLFENEWLVFFTSTFAWEICHALDG
ncbi:hypothetical protein TELCIR_23174 [Teladorsagia circumcincta]|uniref:7TM GPCR serpentine receptor class x (Srx) domain-containing protein n=1 Tax=Teladorsagia circumcincta TaxID=45464 RepID=A0A2G9TBT9_TELCI|nr:hypothetical protein TELCIR_23174 [Teladorsagia circumcincta]